MENRKISHFIQALWHPYGAWKWPFLTKWEIHCLPHYPHMGPFQKNSHLVRVWPRKNGKKREEMLENIKTKLRKFFLPFFLIECYRHNVRIDINSTEHIHLSTYEKQITFSTGLHINFLCIYLKKSCPLSVDNYQLVIFSLQLVFTKNVSSC